MKLRYYYLYRIFCFVLVCCLFFLFIIFLGICVVFNFSIIMLYVRDIIIIGIKYSIIDIEIKYVVFKGMVVLVKLLIIFFFIG